MNQVLNSSWVDSNGSGGRGGWQEVGEMSQKKKKTLPTKECTKYARTLKAKKETVNQPNDRMTRQFIGEEAQMVLRHIKINFTSNQGKCQIKDDSSSRLPE